VIVEGPAGIGKTRLLRSARDAGLEAGATRVLGARATELETHLAFGVVRQLLDPLVFALAGRDRDRGEDLCVRRGVRVERSVDDQPGLLPGRRDDHARLTTRVVRSRG
jgi:hypothetical protein